MNQRDAKFPIPDVQSSPDTRRLAIDRVGVKSIRHPAKIQERSGGTQNTVAHFNMYVGLPHHFKGTHMSRFVAILNAHEREISPDTFRLMLREMVKKLEAAERPHRDDVPVLRLEEGAGVRGGEPHGLRGHLRRRDRRRPARRFTLKVLVPVTSLCPCSKEISERGAHNQRSHVTIAARINAVRVDRGPHRRGGERGLVRALRACSSAPTRSSSPRTPTTIPKFVEDMVRDIAARLNARQAHRRATWWKARTSSPSTTTRPTR